MAVHTYVGARYIPRFTGVYDATQIYEALDVVDNGSGTSYIAKIPVPAGTPVTDTTYWALYGSSSGAIISLQDQIDDINNIDIPGLQSQIDTINNTTIPGVEDSIDDLALDTSTKNKRIVCVGDSYMAHGTKQWHLCLKDLLDVANSDFFSFYELSSGFTAIGQQGHNFEGLLSTNIGSITDRDTITDVFIAGGTNDFYSFGTEAALITAIESMTSYCKSQFPNAKIWVVFCGYYTAMDATMYQNYQITCQAYTTALSNNVRGIYAGAPMKIWGYRYDSQHPNDAGSAKIAEIIYNAMYGSSTYIYGRSAGTLTLPAAYTDNGGSNAIHLNILNNGAVLRILNVNVLATGTVTRNIAITLGTYSAADVQNLQTQNTEIIYQMYFKDSNGIQHLIPGYIVTSVSGTTVTLSFIPIMNPNDSFAYIGFLSLDQQYSMPADVI